MFKDLSLDCPTDSNIPNMTIGHITRAIPKPSRTGAAGEDDYNPIGTFLGHEAQRLLEKEAQLSIQSCMREMQEVVKLSCCEGDTLLMCEFMQTGVHDDLKQCYEAILKDKAKGLKIDFERMIKDATDMWVADLHEILKAKGVNNRVELLKKLAPRWAKGVQQQFEKARDAIMKKGVESLKVLDVVKLRSSRAARDLLTLTYDVSHVVFLLSHKGYKPMQQALEKVAAEYGYETEAEIKAQANRILDTSIDSLPSDDSICVRCGQPKDRNKGVKARPGLSGLVLCANKQAGKRGYTGLDQGGTNLWRMADQALSHGGWQAKEYKHKPRRTQYSGMADQTPRVESGMQRNTGIKQGWTGVRGMADQTPRVEAGRQGHTDVKQG
eukprot:gene18249-24702_t